MQLERRYFSWGYEDWGISAVMPYAVLLGVTFYPVPR